MDTGAVRPGDNIFSAFVALRKQRTRARRLIIGPVLGLTAILAAVLAAAGCGSEAPKTAGTTDDTPAVASGADGPAITAAQARRVFDAYVAGAAAAARSGDESRALSLLTGTQRAVTAAALGSHPVTATPSRGRYSYGTPTFYLPDRVGYPHFFVVGATQAQAGAAAGGRATSTVGGATIPVDGPALLLFEQAAASGPWLLASDSRLPQGMSLPALASDDGGYIPVVQPAAATLLAQPDDVGALQSAVVDEGPSNAAAGAVAAGPLTTGMYQGAVDRVDGLRAPQGDVYQWELQGASYPVFALRTAGGGALVFYAMTLSTTVAVPDVINDADPIRSGPPIQVPPPVNALLPKGQPTPLVQLQSQQILSFAAVDPPTPNAKIQVIAIGGGLTSASAS
jgi:hypothetical protein